jgi:hypothetical protein
MSTSTCARIVTSLRESKRLTELSTKVTVVSGLCALQARHTEKMLMSRRTMLTALAASTVGAYGARPALALPLLPPRPPKSFVMIGDSITAGAQRTVTALMSRSGFSSVIVNGQNSRRIDVGNRKRGLVAGTEVASYVAASHPSPLVWVIALGTNDAGIYRDGAAYADLIEHMLSVVPSTAPLAWINTYRRDQLRSCEILNVALNDVLAKRRNSAVGNWFEQCALPESRLLSSDGVHPNPRGVLAFADTVASAVAVLRPRRER